MIGKNILKKNVNREHPINPPLYIYKGTRITGMKCFEGFSFRESLS